MLSVIIALTGAAGIYYLSLNQLEMGQVLSIIFATVGGILFQVGLGFYFKKKIDSVNKSIQQIMLEGQKKLNRKAGRLQQKPVGGAKTMQKLLEKEQNAFLAEAVDATSALEPYCKWSMLLKKQINTMRMQFNYQMKNYKKVDELLPGCMFFEPMTVAMKMARDYKNDHLNACAKTFKKVKKFKKDDAALIYSLYAWILLKKNKQDDAIKVLKQAKEKVDNEIIVRNWKALANKKPKKFSNAGFGDQWYALGLEEPKRKQKRVKQDRMFM